MAASRPGFPERGGFGVVVGVLLAEHEDTSGFGPGLIVAFVVLTAALVVLFFVLRQETRKRRKR